MSQIQSSERLSSSVPRDEQQFVLFISPTYVEKKGLIEYLLPSGFCGFAEFKDSTRANERFAPKVTEALVGKNHEISFSPLKVNQSETGGTQHSFSRNTRFLLLDIPETGSSLGIQKKLPVTAVYLVLSKQILLETQRQVPFYNMLGIVFDFLTDNSQGRRFKRLSKHLHLVVTEMTQDVSLAKKQICEQLESCRKDLEKSESRRHLLPLLECIVWDQIQPCPQQSINSADLTTARLSNRPTRVFETLPLPYVMLLFRERFTAVFAISIIFLLYHQKLDSQNLAVVALILIFWVVLQQAGQFIKESRDLILPDLHQILTALKQLINQLAGAVAGANNSQRQLTGATVELINSLDEIQRELLQKSLPSSCSMIVEEFRNLIKTVKTQIDSLGSDCRGNMSIIRDSVLRNGDALTNSVSHNLDRIITIIDDLQKGGVKFLRSDVKECSEQWASAFRDVGGLKKIVNIQTGVVNN